VQGSSVPTIRLCDERTSAKKVHNVQPIEPLLPKIFEEGHNLVRDEAGMTRRDMRALYVFSLKPDTERVDPLKSAYSVFEGMIDHADQRDLVVQNAANSFERRFALVSCAAAVKIPPELAVEFVIPEFGDANPISIVARRSIRETKLVLPGIEYYFDTLVPTQRPRERDDSLLAVDEPIH
jgi:hypothetical protein